MYHVDLEGEVQLALGPRLLVGLGELLVNGCRDVVLAAVHSALNDNFSIVSRTMTNEVKEYSEVVGAPILDKAAVVLRAVGGGEVVDVVLEVLIKRRALEAAELKSEGHVCATSVGEALGAVVGELVDLA